MSKDLLTIVNEAISEKLGNHIVVIDFRGVSPFNDYFVITSALNQRMAHSIAENVEKKVLENNFECKNIEGEETNWILMDLGDIVVHIFVGEDRNFYNLEKLWGDLPQEEVKI